MQQTLIEKIARELATNPAWQVRAQETTWLCPYCGETGAKGRAIEDIVPQVAKHLDRCPGFRQGQGRPMAVPVLRQKALLMELANNLSTQKPWRVIAPNSYWICPFCVKISDVRFPKETAKIDVTTLQGILAHLNACAVYDGGRGRLRTVEEIRQIATDAMEQKKFIGDIRAKLTSSEVWRVKDKGDVWVCPYCRRPVAGIMIPSQFLLMESAPALIAKHLKERCTPFRKKTAPAKTAAELQAAAGLAEPETAAEPVKPAAAPAAGEGVWLKEIESGLRDLKAQVELNKDIERGLSEARKKQLEMLPAIPQIPGFDFAAFYKPCTSLGGDFYDFVGVSSHETGVAMGDVSGHGIEAAIVMSMVKKLLNVHGRGKSYSGATLRATNRDIHEDLDGRTFVTVLYGVLNTETKVFNFVRAGHTLPILFNPARKPDVQFLNSAGMVVGVDKGTAFDAVLEEKMVQLQSGDVILLYTDGLTETMDSKGEILGDDRLADLVRKHGVHDMEYLLHRLDLGAAQFRGDAPQADDIAMVAFKVP